MDLFSVEVIRGFAPDVLGFAACAATLLTFAQKRMRPMRVSAITANLFFIGYGALELLYPVLLLHVVLLPLNVARLVQLVACSSPPTGAGSGSLALDRKFKTARRRSSPQISPMSQPR